MRVILSCPFNLQRIEPSRDDDLKVVIDVWSGKMMSFERSYLNIAPDDALQLQLQK